MRVQLVSGMAIPPRASTKVQSGSGSTIQPRASTKEDGADDLRLNSRPKPAINALVTAGDAPSISARSCFSCHLGPGPRI